MRARLEWPCGRGARERLGGSGRDMGVGGVVGAGVGGKKRWF
jgi:hypothetical protein